MKTYASAHMFHAVNQCGWDEEQQLTVYCGHIATIIAGGDYEKLFNATQTWRLDSGIPASLVMFALARIIDEIETAPDYNGEYFEDYLKSLLEASGVTTTADKKTEPEKPTSGKRRGRKKGTTTATAQVPEKAPKEKPTRVTVRSEPEKKPELKFPVGTLAEPAPVPAAKPVPVVAESPKIMLVGHLDKPFAEVSKQLLAMQTPVKEQRLGALMAQQKFSLPDDMELVLELLNARPKPGVYVSICKSGRSLTLPVVVRDFTERYEIVYQNTTYKVLPSGG